jgi:hypothetical protein
VLTSNLVTPCATEDSEGTFYQFYQQDGATPGVYNLGLASTFNFKPTPPTGGCSAITCGQAVDMVFVVDEQSTATTGDFSVIKQFINGVIELQANGATPPARFLVAWVCTPGYSYITPPLPLALQGTTPVTGFVQTTMVNAHTQRFCSPDFASAITTVLNTVFPVASANPRKLITIVGGPDAGTDPNRFTNLQALLTKLNVEAWTYGVDQGASDSVLLQNLATQGGGYAHFVSVPSPVQFPNFATTQGLLSCPPANLCGAACKDFCSCINTCVCSSGGCTQDLCSQTRVCDPVTKGCSGPAVNCDSGDLGSRTAVTPRQGAPSARLYATTAATAPPTPATRPRASASTRPSTATTTTAAQPTCASRATLSPLSVNTFPTAAQASARPATSAPTTRCADHLTSPHLTSPHPTSHLTPTTRCAKT